MLRIDKKEGFFEFRHEAMATEYVFSIAYEDREYAQQAAHEAFALLDDIEGKLSFYRESSDVTRINRAKIGDVVAVSQDCIDCLRISMEASALSEGAFHAFLGWEACRSKNATPSFLSEMRERIEASDLESTAIEMDVENRCVRKSHDKSLLDFGGIGKGFALDRAMELLLDWDLGRVLLNAGGSALLFRSEDGSESWSGRLENGRSLVIQNGALASSGLGFQADHIVNPKVGRSAVLWERSYVYAESAALADALSTAVMNMDWPRIQTLPSAKSDVSILTLDLEGEKACGALFA